MLPSQFSYHNSIPSVPFADIYPIAHEAQQVLSFGDLNDLFTSSTYAKIEEQNRVKNEEVNGDRVTALSVETKTTSVCNNTPLDTPVPLIEAVKPEYLFQEHKDKADYPLEGQTLRMGWLIPEQLEDSSNINRLVDKLVLENELLRMDWSREPTQFAQKYARKKDKTSFTLIDGGNINNLAFDFTKTKTRQHKIVVLPDNIRTMTRYRGKHMQCRVKKLEHTTWYLFRDEGNGKVCYDTCHSTALAEHFGVFNPSLETKKNYPGKWVLGVTEPEFQKVIFDTYPSLKKKFEQVYDEVSGVEKGVTKKFCTKWRELKPEERNFSKDPDTVVKVKKFRQSDEMLGFPTATINETTNLAPDHGLYASLPDSMLHFHYNPQSSEMEKLNIDVGHVANTAASTLLDLGSRETPACKSMRLTGLEEEEYVEDAKELCLDHYLNLQPDEFIKMFESTKSME